MQQSQLIEEGEVRIRRRGAERIRRGHLWVYRSDIINEGHAGPGSIVQVRDERGAIMGKAFYSSKSQIALRFLTRRNVPITEEWIRNRLLAASERREKLGIDPRLSRRIHAEGDLMPGLIVDRYGDYLVVQSLTQATDRLEPLVVSIFQEQYQPRSILFRNDSKVRELEGLPLEQHSIGDAIPERVTVDVEGRTMEVALSSGQKTGAFLDQRENQAAARRYARGRALDAFTYTGGFALAISSVCKSVEALDLSASALELASANAARNHIHNVTFTQGNVFDVLRQRFEDGERYDTIILDPPAFAKSRDNLDAALRGYREINSRAMRLLSDGGVLISCTCSHHVSEGLFAEMLAESGRDAGVWLRVLERRIQASDHPVLLTVPETLYLKCFILEVAGN